MKLYIRIVGVIISISVCTWKLKIKRHLRRKEEDVRLGWEVYNVGKIAFYRRLFF